MAPDPICARMVADGEAFAQDGDALFERAQDRVQDSAAMTTLRDRLEAGPQIQDLIRAANRAASDPVDERNLQWRNQALQTSGLTLFMALPEALRQDPAHASLPFMLMSGGLNRESAPAPTSAPGPAPAPERATLQVVDGTPENRPRTCSCGPACPRTATRSSRRAMARKPCPSAARTRRPTPSCWM